MERKYRQIMGCKFKVFIDMKDRRNFPYERGIYIIYKVCGNDRIAEYIGCTKCFNHRINTHTTICKLRRSLIEPEHLEILFCSLPIHFESDFIRKLEPRLNTYLLYGSTKRKKAA